MTPSTDAERARFRLLTLQLMDDREVRFVFQRPLRHLDRPAWIVRKKKLVRSFLLRHMASGSVPDMVGLWGLPTRRQTASLRRWLEAERSAIPFVGDLSPSVLAVWTIIRQEAREVGVEVPWHGVRDAWLFDPIVSRLPRLTLPQPEGDVRLWRELSQLPGMDLAAAVGPACVRLLNAGQKLELDALMNPTIFSAEVHRELISRAGLAPRAD